MVHMQVVSGASQALCCLARLSPSAGQRLTALMTLYMGHLNQRHPLLLTPPADPAAQQANVAYTCRYACLSTCVLYTAYQLADNGTQPYQVCIQTHMDRLSMSSVPGFYDSPSL